MLTLFRDAGARMEEGSAGTVLDEPAPSPSLYWGPVSIPG
jgi:hypothetical protein